MLERALDMRYVGQSHEITVHAPDNGDWYEAFHAAHSQRYGHRHDDEPVEVVNARLKAVGRTPKPVFTQMPVGIPDASEAQFGEGLVWFSADRAASTPYYDRDKLKAGNRIEGPAVVFQFDTTVVISPQWIADVDSWGNLVLHQGTA